MAKVALLSNKHVNYQPVIKSKRLQKERKPLQHKINYREQGLFYAENTTQSGR
jgi:hypothetical protein